MIGTIESYHQTNHSLPAIWRMPGGPTSHLAVTGVARSNKEYLAIVLSITCRCLLLLSLLMFSAQTSARNILLECMNLSTENDDIQTCLDNFLDDMDSRITDISTEIEEVMSDDSLAAFSAAQVAFRSYLKQNCLWYLSFSAPRQKAEQIAKSCLATMTQQRYAELRSLLASNDGPQIARGFYVYGANRNSFQLCDSEQRYWVEGDNLVVGQLQQTYLSQATSDLQVLYAELKGNVAEESQKVDGHAGVFLATELLDVRVPQESDCRLPVSTLADSSAGDSITSIIPATNGVANDAESGEEEESEQQLRAFFGEWLVDCIQQGKIYECNLSVALRDASKPANESITTVSAAGTVPTLVMNRSNERGLNLHLRFPDLEIDEPQKVRWRVDGFTFDIIESEIRVDERASRLLVTNKKYVNEELLPLLRKGNELALIVLEDVDDESGLSHLASLQGVTRALAFADDFVKGGENQ